MDITGPHMQPSPTESHQRPRLDNKSWWLRAQGVLSSGLWTVHQGSHEYAPEIFPLLAVDGEGPWLIDGNGRRYVDWIMGWGPNLLGYRHPAVEGAMQQQLRNTPPLLSLLNPLEVEVAETIRDIVPCAERVAFGKNGSDALGAAVRLARAITGREGVLVCGYHGFHDWYQAVRPEVPGIPNALRWLVRQFEFNNTQQLEHLFSEHGPQIAAIVMEPAHWQTPNAGYLEAVRRLCTKNSTVLIFDEVVTFLRLARGGAQEAYGVTPDIACLGKSLANGMPLSAIVGRAEIMDGLHHVGYGLTFRGETLSLAAAKASLGVHLSTDVAAHVHHCGDKLRSAFRKQAADHGIVADLLGPPPRLTMSFAASGNITPLGLQTLFIEQCTSMGVLTNGNFLPSLAHDEESISITSLAFAKAMQTLATTISRGSLEGFLRSPISAQHQHHNSQL